MGLLFAIYALGTIAASVAVPAFAWRRGGSVAGCFTLAGSALLFPLLLLLGWLFNWHADPYFLGVTDATLAGFLAAWAHVAWMKSPPRQLMPLWALYGGIAFALAMALLAGSAVGTMEGVVAAALGLAAGAAGALGLRRARELEEEATDDAMRQAAGCAELEQAILDFDRLEESCQDAARSSPDDADRRLATEALQVVRQGQEEARRVAHQCARLRAECRLPQSRPMTLGEIVAAGQRARRDVLARDVRESLTSLDGIRHRVEELLAGIASRYAVGSAATITHGAARLDDAARRRELDALEEELETLHDRLGTVASEAGLGIERVGLLPEFDGVRLEVVEATRQLRAILVHLRDPSRLPASEAERFRDDRDRRLARLHGAAALYRDTLGELARRDAHPEELGDPLNAQLRRAEDARRSAASARERLRELLAE